MRPTTSSVFLALATTGAAIATLGGCVDALPPATTLASAPATPSPHEALVTFVRPASPCDAGEYAVVVDGHGRFVGNLAPDTQVQFATTPGEHYFYAWSNVELLIDKVPNFNPVAAIYVKATAGDNSYVVIDTPKPCQSRILFEMYGVNEARPVWDELKGWLASARPVSVDREAGQHDLESRPAHLQVNLALGSRKLRENEDTFARRKLRAALDRESLTAE